MEAKQSVVIGRGVKASFDVESPVRIYSRNNGPIGHSLGSCGDSLSGASAGRRVTSKARVAHSRSIDIPHFFLLVCLCFFGGTPPRIPPTKPSGPVSQATSLTFPCVDFGTGRAGLSVESSGEKVERGLGKMSPFGDP